MSSHIILSFLRSLFPRAASSVIRYVLCGPSVTKALERLFQLSQSISVSSQPYRRSKRTEFDTKYERIFGSFAPLKARTDKATIRQKIEIRRHKTKRPQIEGSPNLVCHLNRPNDTLFEIQINYANLTLGLPAARPQGCCASVTGQSETPIWPGRRRQKAAVKDYGAPVMS